MTAGSPCIVQWHIRGENVWFPGFEIVSTVTALDREFRVNVRRLSDGAEFYELAPECVKAA